MKEAENDGKGNALVMMHGPYERAFAVFGFLPKYAQLLDVSPVLSYLSSINVREVCVLADLESGLL